MEHILEPRRGSTKGSPAFVAAFVALQAFGFLGSLAILLTVLLSKNVKRYPTWISFCVAWIISAFSYLLLFISGTQQPARHFDATNAACLVQASLVYSGPVLNACTSLALVFQLWQFITNSAPRYKRVVNALLLIGPYVLWVLMTVTLLIRGAMDKKVIAMEGGLYCGQPDGIPGDTSAGIVIFAMAVTLLFEFLLARILFINWRKLRHESTSGSQVSIGMISRVVVFNVFGLLGIGTGAAFLSNNQTGRDIANMLIALMPVAFVLVFGTQSDIMRAWMFWGKDDTPLPVKDMEIHVEIEDSTSKV